ncbi:hypothetical protein CL617_02835 [archaeon]|nr:hypothetical protein [archaeon]|tara:strand:- start:7222 stop:8433 length:1212 start_codon:yes stop_codon:yes gene_type:complete
MKEEIKSKLEGNISKIYLIAVLSGFTFFYNEIVTLYYRNFELSFTQISFLLVIVMATILLFEVPTGAFADLYGRRLSILLGSIFMTIGLVIIAFSSVFSLFVVAAIIIGISSAFFSGSWSALVYDTLKELKREKEYLKILSRIEIAFLFVGIISAYFGPYLFSFNVRWPYYISSIAAIIWIFAIFSLYEPPLEYSKKINIKDHYIQMKDGLIFVTNHSKLIWLIFFSAIMAIIAITVGELIMGPFIISIGFSLKEFALIALVSNIIQTVFVFFIDKIENKIGEKKSFLLVIIGIFFILILMTFTRNYFISVVFGLFWAIMSFRELILEKYINHHLEKENRATVLSIHSMSLALLGLIMAPFLGYIIDLTSLSYSVVFLAILVGVIGSILIFFRYSGRVWKNLT